MTEASRYLAQLSTEQLNASSSQLDTLTGEEIARLMNEQDASVTAAVAHAVPVIGKVIDETAARMRRGGHLLYIGAGTSGRLGVLDASECPPTFGVAPSVVHGIIAGGDYALRNAVEGAEDHYDQGVLDVREAGAGPLDVVVAISASGFARYCAGALDEARRAGALAVSMTCNVSSALSEHADLAIEAPTGAEVLMGSTRLKAGTATKMMLNMLSTGAMVRCGRVYKNLMVDLNVSNAKLEDRALRIIGHATGAGADEALRLLREANGSVKTAIVLKLGGVSAARAKEALEASGGWVHAALGSLRSDAPSA
ncbi:MAG: N-acetylmuramic acid 6-phosphate etherase [Clostridia bacterium]|nr:N-acetylmuramic acid 6-phosphate etherase [Clostridia bacterium]